ncbi:uncharacterized protein L969DRAFT_17928 [Mixia osmundae IAM 14324]|uniref:Uncharacterized protein n=1 Tax=Mixia osmundae (strain CBS 9802 / IAM 14324 / JCM 22182 / KY 12970) TaxID=764103 RepID=G7E108_MIXOS|nr:uncharacterized protein L969DRAFT_17928 [Mixia osmundae IAM 14324]KEI38847.1 hypothetical protein L969DRAFT_17928 [Mixia osmundae IAM 14324]GAA96518.1 hypothetical protein E5Q_03186 [Mixia osmundae IAM 14324]
MLLLISLLLALSRVILAVLQIKVTGSAEILFKLNDGHSTVTGRSRLFSKTITFVFDNNRWRGFGDPTIGTVNLLGTSNNGRDARYQVIFKTQLFDERALPRGDLGCCSGTMSYVFTLFAETRQMVEDMNYRYGAAQVKCDALIRQATCWTRQSGIHADTEIATADLTFVVIDRP